MISIITYKFVTLLRNARRLGCRFCPGSATSASQVSLSRGYINFNSTPAVDSSATFGSDSELVNDDLSRLDWLSEKLTVPSVDHFLSQLLEKIAAR